MFQQKFKQKIKSVFHQTLFNLKTINLEGLYTRRDFVVQCQTIVRETLHPYLTPTPLRSASS